MSRIGEGMFVDQSQMDFCVIAHEVAATVVGELMRMRDEGKRVTFRPLQVWEFRDGTIGRENDWMDGSSVAAQLTGAAS